DSSPTLSPLFYVSLPWCVLCSCVAGVAVFAGIISSWQIPFFFKLGWPGVRAVWASDTAMRIWEITPSAVAQHLVTYPFEVIGCTLPWSLFLLVFLSPEFRRRFGPKK